MSALIRATVIQGLDQVVHEAGGDSSALLSAHGIDPESLQDFDRYLLYDDAAAALGDAAQRLPCPDIGLRLGQRQTVQILGPIGVIFRNAATVGDAFDGVSRFIGRVAPIDSLTMERSPDRAILSYESGLYNRSNRALMIEKTLTVAMGALRWMVGETFVPLRVTFSHQASAAPEKYREVFGRPVEFGSNANSIHLPLRILEREVPERDGAALTLAERYLSGIRSGLTLESHVAEVTRRLMVVDHGTLIDVARSLTLHPRVLQRRLAAEGLTFEAILDDVRRRLARELLAEGLSAGQIARELGYAEQSSFSRACKRWYGMSPRQLQARIREGSIAGLDGR